MQVSYWHRWEVGREGGRAGGRAAGFALVPRATNALDQILGPDLLASERGK